MPHFPKLTRPGAALLLALSAPAAAASVCAPGERGWTTRTPAGLRYHIPQPLYDWTRYYAAQYGLEPGLLMALIWQESRYCPRDVSPRGAVGLGQLMPGTAAAMGIDPRNPVHNIYGAARYLREQYDAFGDWSLALAAYNAGPARVRRARGVPPIPETAAYVNRVLATYQAFRQVR